MRWKTALGREVVDTSTAESTGSLDGMVADPTASRITALIVGDQIVTWEDAGGIGTDAVTVSGAGLFRDPESDLEHAAIDGPGDPIGRAVLTEQGFALGKVGDIEFDAESGAIHHLLVDDAEIAGSRLIGIGSYAVVVSGERTEYG